MRHHGRHERRVPSGSRWALAVPASAAFGLCFGLFSLAGCLFAPSQSKTSGSPAAAKHSAAPTHAGAAGVSEGHRGVVVPPGTGEDSRELHAARSDVRLLPPPPVALRLRRPHDPPLIYGVTISATDVHAGDTVSGTVTTSSNVASVVASVGGTSASVPKVGVGEFALSYRLPAFIPPFIKGTYSIVIVARNVDGAATSRAVAITLH